MSRELHNTETFLKSPRQRIATLNIPEVSRIQFEGSDLRIYARLERDSRTESVEEYFCARSGTRDSNSYFFLSPLHFVNLIRVFWTSSRSRRILTGRERDAENWTTVKPRPVPRDQEEEEEEGGGGLDGRCWTTMARDV